MKRMNRCVWIVLFALGLSSLQAQVRDSIPDTQIEPPQEDVAPRELASLDPPATTGERRKLDGIAAVVGDYVILDSDVEKTMIDLKNQGATDAEIDDCSLLGKLMEDRLYAHQAVQDSILVSDDEVYAQSDRYLQQLEQRLGSMEKLLQFYNKESAEDLREELFQINKLQMLSQKMQQKVVGDIKVTPEEVRQFFRSIPEDEKPVFGAELEIAQIVIKPEVPEAEKQKVIDQLKRHQGGCGG